MGAPIVEAYLSGPERLRAAVSGMSREPLISRPIPGKWSVLEVVCHLADTDANIAISPQKGALRSASSV